MAQKRFTKAKTVAAALGSTVLLVSTAFTSVQVALDDGALDAAEYGLILTTAVTLVGAVYAVWRVPNKEVPVDQSSAAGHRPY